MHVRTSRCWCIVLTILSAKVQEVSRATGYCEHSLDQGRESTGEAGFVVDFFVKAFMQR